MPEEPRMTASRLADELRRKIEQGDYAPGEGLPSHRALMAEHGIARNTAASAIDMLASQGLVEVHQGKGVWVREQPRLLRFGIDRYSLARSEETRLPPLRADVEVHGHGLRVNCTAVDRLTAPSHVAERLNEPDPLDAVRRENWYFTNDGPVQCGITWIPWHIAGDSPLGHSADTGPGNIHSRFAELGHTITTVREEVQSRMPSPSERDLLHLRAGVPVLVVTHTGYDQNERPFEVTVFTLRADRIALDYRMQVSPAQA